MISQISGLGGPFVTDRFTTNYEVGAVLFTSLDVLVVQLLRVLGEFGRISLVGLKLSLAWRLARDFRRYRDGLGRRGATKCLLQETSARHLSYSNLTL